MSSGWVKYITGIRRRHVNKDFWTGFRSISHRLNRSQVLMAMDGLFACILTWSARSIGSSSSGTKCRELYFRVGADRVIFIFAGQAVDRVHSGGESFFEVFGKCISFFLRGSGPSVGLRLGQVPVSLILERYLEWMVRRRLPFNVPSDSPYFGHVVSVSWVQIREHPVHPSPFQVRDPSTLLVGRLALSQGEVWQFCPALSWSDVGVCWCLWRRGLWWRRHGWLPALCFSKMY
ncbi:uncharacterized protein Dana_GF26717, isoform F [Drosophila ananassae]|uniref:Uncharacterized protein, isoform F n=1 Tax=Drosophila ananassae TaxID=7217 RepID=A0A0P8Y516_DROAN|nr:uncharacterized protein Dana_GF26717, isoform F [Drosophila ananassae]